LPAKENRADAFAASDFVHPNCDFFCSVRPGKSILGYRPSVKSLSVDRACALLAAIRETAISPDVFLTVNR
jgi:hypothetical protein